jgi:GAF domain-containing protein
MPESTPSVLEAMDLFRGWFRGASWSTWRAVLGALFGLQLSEADQAIIRQLTGHAQCPQAPCREGWFVMGRRAGKSLLAAFVAVYLAVFRSYDDVLQRGERGTLMLIAADRRQARTLMRYVLGFFELPGLAGLIEWRTQDALYLTNRVVIEIHTASFKSVRGYTLIGAICDEVAFWTAEDWANPDVEIITALRPALATVPGSLLLAISSPYARRGLLWKQYNAGHGRPGPSLVVQAPSVVMNPTLIADADTQPDIPESVRRMARARGWRSNLAVPLRRTGTAIGALGVSCRDARGFTLDEVALLQTFADQAVIAIENVRLFNETREALEQQTATSEILRVISSSPTDIQPTLEAVAASAARVCGATDAVILRVEGQETRRVAHCGAIPLILPEMRRITPGSPGGRAILDFAREYPETAAVVRDAGWRTILVVPLVREGAAIGVISLRRTEVRPFTDKEIALLETFADQAVIAIENVRLFKELQARNQELTVALAQQTATSEVLAVISGAQTAVQPVFEAIVQSARRLCEASYSSVYRLDNQLVHLVAHNHQTPEAAETFRYVWPMPLTGDSFVARAIRENAVIHTDMQEDPTASAALIARGKAVGHRRILVVPMVREGHPIGAIRVSRVERTPFAEQHIALLKTFADQAVIAIENVRLFKELEGRNRELTEALEQQTATAEILRVISSSPTDLQPVLVTVAENAARVCGAIDAQIYRVEGEFLHWVASHGPIPPNTEERLISRGSVTGRAVVDRRTIHVHDLAAESDTEYPVGKAAQRQTGHRTTLATPLLREGVPLGVISIRRMEVRPFSEQQVRLLETFADQAVIAIENVRLFRELQEKNRALTAAHAQVTEALEQQTAMSEILRVISRSPTDIQPVLDAVAESAARLCESLDAAVYRRDGDRLVLVAHHGLITPGLVGEFSVPVIRGTVNGRAVLDGRTVHVAGVQTSAAEFPVGSVLARGERLHWKDGQSYVGATTPARTLLSVPLMRKGIAIGTINLRRAEAQLFSDRQVALLETFADQAAIAIENVRLFTELQVRNADLTEALDRQTATAEILRVISQSQTEVRPVFEAIVDNAIRLFRGWAVAVMRSDGQRLHLSRRVAACQEPRSICDDSRPGQFRDCSPPHAA